MYVFPTLQPITSAGASNAVLAKVPKLDTSRRRRQRSAALACRPIPETTVFQVNTPFNNLSPGTPFTVYDNEKQDMVPIFATKYTLDSL